MTSTLDQGADDESWGFREFKLFYEPKEECAIFTQNVTLKEQLSTFVQSHLISKKITYLLLFDQLKYHLRLRSLYMKTLITMERRQLTQQAKIAQLHLISPLPNKVGTLNKRKDGLKYPKLNQRGNM